MYEKSQNTVEGIYVYYTDAVSDNVTPLKRVTHVFRQILSQRHHSPAARGSGTLNAHNFFCRQDRALEPCCVCHNVMFLIVKLCHFQVGMEIINLDFYN